MLCSRSVRPLAQPVKTKVAKKKKKRASVVGKGSSADAAGNKATKRKSVTDAGTSGVA
jgi:hypothetical protein